MVTQKIQFLVVAIDPAPYKTDQFNAFARVPDWQTVVFYARSRDWSWDAGHNFQMFPQRDYAVRISKGKGVEGHIISAIQVFRQLLFHRPAIVLVSGYYGVAYMTAIVGALLLRIPFAFAVDQFNEECRSRIFGMRWLRSLLQKVIFKWTVALLVCGRPGTESAIKAGCPPRKILNFPYVIDAERLSNLSRTTQVRDLPLPIQKGLKLILFSGRFIQRKGLDVLLRALAQLKREGKGFFLMIEGEGPLRKKYEALVHEFALQDDCVFAGFRQMDEHAYLLRIANIVIVPSTEDPWGIVVHEGMLMEKPVCASDVVGAAIDRIETGKNGFLFPSGDWQALAQHIDTLLHDDELCARIGRAARTTAEEWSPERNVNVFVSFVRSRGLI